ALFEVLKAGWGRVQAQEAASSLRAVLVNTDNRVVKETMCGAKDPPELRELRERTGLYQRLFEQEGITVRYELVVCSFPSFKPVHEMCVRKKRELVLLPAPLKPSA
ncbi:MAG TPA: hypothetical protein VNY31_10540, partial [Solirubrobacteraceae bacterium]|nr:hypothetical protein [Solirubrobacteraceae bacterium]